MIMIIEHWNYPLKINIFAGRNFQGTNFFQESIFAILTKFVKFAKLVFAKYTWIQNFANIFIVSMHQKFIYYYPERI